MNISKTGNCCVSKLNFDHGTEIARKPGQKKAVFKKKSSLAVPAIVLGEGNHGTAGRAVSNTRAGFDQPVVRARSSRPGCNVDSA